MAPLVINNHELAEELSAVNIVMTFQKLGLRDFDFEVYNYINVPLNVYYSNYSALYYIDGEYYVLPPNVYYLNYS